MMRVYKIENNINKERFYVYLIISIVGIVSLLLGGLYIMNKEKKNKNNKK